MLRERGGEEHRGQEHRVGTPGCVGQKQIKPACRAVDRGAHRGMHTGPCTQGHAHRGEDHVNGRW